jgi:HEAT repeats
MDYEAAFVRHFARLVWLLLHEPQASDAQKGALHAMTALSREGVVTIGVRHRRVMAGAAQIPEGTPGVPDLAAGMARRGVRRLVIGRGATPAELLALARLLASIPEPGEDAARLAARLGGTGRGVVGVEPARGTPDEGMPVAAHPAGATAALLARLDDAPPSGVPEALDALARSAEEALARGEADAAADVAHRVMTRAREARATDTRRAMEGVVERMLTPPLLQGVAALLPRRPARFHVYLDLLERAGVAGADAVIAQLGGAPSIGERRLYFDVLRMLDAAVPALTRMLGDTRSHQVRSAAGLLGLLHAYDAEPRLASLLTHDDPRVRRAAVLSLAELGTSTAQRRVREAMNLTPER